MAKKVVVPETAGGGGVKRERGKRSKCCTCCIAILIALVVILSGAFAAGWFIGDKFTKQYFDMSMGDTMGVVGGLYYAKDKKVVKNPYGDEDLDKFYGQIKTNILLKEDADADFHKALTDALTGMLGADQSSAEAGRIVKPKNADGDSDTGGAISSIGDIFGDMLSEVFTRDNIDIVKLREYSEENDTYIFDLQDRGLAAFIDAVLGAVLDSGAFSLPDMLSSVKISDYVKLKQITFKAVSSSNELGENTVSATTADITLWVGLQSVAGKVIKGYTQEAGIGWAGGIGSFVGNIILPKNLYATVTLPLKGETDPHFTLNAMNEKKRDNTYKLVNGVFGLTGSNMTVQGFMTDTLSSLTPMLDSLAQKADMTSAAQGVIKFDFLGTLADLVNSSSENGDPITKADFIYLLQALLTTDADVRREQLRPYLYKGWYRPKNNGSATPEYNPADKTGKVEVDYGDEFVKEISDKYCIDFGDKSLNDVLAMLGISMDGNNSSAGSTDLLKAINNERFHKALRVADDQISTLDLRVTDRMLAAAFDGQMESLLTNGGTGLNGLGVGLDAITFVTKTNRPGRQYALLAVSINIANFFGGDDSDSILGQLAARILPEKLIISIFSDVTDGVAKADRDEVTYMFNDYENTHKVVGTLEKIMPELNLNTICASIDDMLYNMIESLDKQIGITLVPSVPSGDTMTQGAMMMPNIFKFMADMVIVDADKKPVVTDAELKNVILGLDDVDGIDGEKHIADNYKGFLGSVTDKYYLNPERELETFDELTNFVNGGVTKSKFRFDGGESNTAVNPLIYDKRTPAELRPIMTGEEIGALIVEKMAGDAGINQQFEILSVKGVDGGLELLLAIKIGSIMPENMLKLISADKMYVTTKFDTTKIVGSGTESDPYAYDVTMTINKMEDDTRADALKIVSTLDSSVKIDEQVKSFGRLFYDTLNNLKKSLDSEGNLGEVFTFTENGLELIDFYSFLGGKLGINMDKTKPGYTDPAIVQRAIQGMYERSAVEDYVNPANYVADYINYNATDSILVNKPNEGNDNLSIGARLSSGEELKDKDLNGFFSNIGQGAGVSAAQTVILAANDNSDRANDMRTRLNKKLSSINPAENTSDTSVDNTKSYLIITFKLEMSKFLGSTDTAGAGTFLPANVYATIVYEKPNGGDFKQLGIVFNDMDKEVYSIMFKLMKLDASAQDDSTVNIFSIAKDSAKILNVLRTGEKDFTLAKQTQSDNSLGYGTIKFE